MSIRENTNLQPEHSEVYYYKKFFSIAKSCTKGDSETKTPPIIDMKYTIKAPQLAPSGWKTPDLPIRTPLIYPQQQKQTNAASFGHSISTLNTENEGIKFFTAGTGTLELVNKDKYTKIYGETHDDITLMCGYTNKNRGDLIKSPDNKSLIPANKSSKDDKPSDAPKSKFYWAAKAIMANREDTYSTTQGIADYTSTSIGLGGKIQHNANLTPSIKWSSSAGGAFGSIQEASTLGDSNKLQTNGYFCNTDYDAFLEHSSPLYKAVTGSTYAKSEGAYSQTPQITKWSNKTSMGFDIAGPSHEKGNTFSVNPNVYQAVQSTQTPYYNRHISNMGFGVDATYSYETNEWGVSAKANVREQNVHARGSETRPINEPKNGLGCEASVGGFYRVSDDVRIAANIGCAHNTDRGSMNYASLEVSSRLSDSCSAYIAADWTKNKRGEAITPRAGLEWEFSSHGALSGYYAPPTKDTPNSRGTVGVEVSYKF